MWVTLVLIGGGLTGVILAHDRQPPAPATTAPNIPQPPAIAASADATQDDADAADLISAANHDEALAWLSDPTAARGVARWEKSEVIDLVKGFYTAGAPKVYVVDINRVAQCDIASQFIVLLPTDPRLRKQVFDCEANFQAQYDDDPTPDTGQKYLTLTTD
jgi:hypothetical protein